MFPHTQKKSIFLFNSNCFSKDQQGCTWGWYAIRRMFTTTAHSSTSLFKFFKRTIHALIWNCSFKYTTCGSYDPSPFLELAFNGISVLVFRLKCWNKFERHSFQSLQMDDWLTAQKSGFKFKNNGLFFSWFSFEMDFYFHIYFSMYCVLV